MAKKKPRPEVKIPIDPRAAVFAPGDKIVVKRRFLWTGYRGMVSLVDGGMCRVRIKRYAGAPQSFLADIPATELQHDL